MRTWIAAVLLVLSAACQMSGSVTPQWQAGEFAVPSENVLWAVSAQEVQRVGYPVGSQANPSELLMTSGWKTMLAPFRGKGYRERAELQFTRVAPDRYKLEVRVAKEVNNDMISPLDPSHAEWKAVDDNVEAAQILLHRIRARLSDPLEVSAPRARP